MGSSVSFNLNNLGNPGGQPAASSSAPPAPAAPTSSPDGTIQFNMNTLGQPRDMANRELAKSGLSVSGMPSDTPDQLKKGLADQIMDSPAYQHTKDIAEFYPNTLKGGLKGAGQTVLDLDNIIRKGANKLGAHYDQIDETDLGMEKGSLKQDGIAENVGGFGESVLEFMAGEGAVSGLSKAAKLKKLAGIATFLERYPRIAKIVGVGLKTGAVQTGLAAVHGDENPGTEGLVAGALGAATEGGSQVVSNILKKVKPSAVDIGGEKIPALASQVAGDNATGVVKAAGDIRSAPKIAEAQQKGAQKVIANTAQQSTSDALDRINATRETTPVAKTTDVVTEAPAGPEAPRVPGSENIEEGIKAQNAKRQLGSASATVPDRLMPQNPVVEKVGSQAAAIPDSVLGAKSAPEARTVVAEGAKTTGGEPKIPKASVSDALSRVNNFGDAAEEIQKAAKPAFEKLDEVSGGQYTAIREQIKNARKVLMHPSSMDAAEAASTKLDEAESALDDLFTKHEGDIGKADLSAAKSAWRDSKMLENIHTAVNRSFNIPDQTIANRAGLSRKLAGDTLTKRLNVLVEKSGRENIERVIGKDGLTNLYKVADLTSSPETSSKTWDVLRHVGERLHRAGRGALIGGLITAPFGHAYAGAFAGAAVEDASRFVLNKAATNPRVAGMIENAVKTGANPKVYAPLILQEMRRQNQEQE